MGLILSCKSGREKADVITEDGVEVVLNHLKPYVLRDEHRTLSLKRLFSIDTEKDTTAAQGLTDIYLFDVDSTGAVYILRPPTSAGDLAFKFSNKGEFVTSFARMGQGPNEMEYPSQIMATSQGNVWITEGPKNKYHIFDINGTPVAEKKMSPGIDSMTPLKNEYFLVNGMITNNKTAKYFPLFISLQDANLRMIKELDRFRSYPNRPLATSFPEKIINGIGFVFSAIVRGDRIYIGNSERGYEIMVYDLNGRLIRKIRKEYTPVPVSEEYRRDYLKFYKSYMPDYANKIYFPENWHPFRSFFCDESGHLFIMTYELGENPGEYFFDIFNKDGRFFARKSMNVFCAGNTLLARAQDSHLYFVQEKKNGYKEIIAYEMTWK